MERPRAPSHKPLRSHDRRKCTRCCLSRLSSVKPLDELTYQPLLCPLVPSAQLSELSSAEEAARLALRSTLETVDALQSQISQKEASASETARALSEARSELQAAREGAREAAERAAARCGALEEEAAAARGAAEEERARREAAERFAEEARREADAARAEGRAELGRMASAVDRARSELSVSQAALQAARWAAPARAAVCRLWGSDLRSSASRARTPLAPRRMTGPPCLRECLSKLLGGA